MSYHVELNTVRALIDRLPQDETIGSPALQVRGAFNAAEVELSKLVDIQLNPDDMASEKANAIRLEAQRTKFQDVLKAAASRAAKAVSDLRSAQLARQTEAANLKESEHASEIRSVYRGLSNADKLSFMQQAIDGNDSQVIAALTNPATSPLLTGLSGQQMAHYRAHYIDKFSTTDTSYVDAIQVVSETLVGAVSHI